MSREAYRLVALTKNTYFLIYARRFIALIPREEDVLYFSQGRFAQNPVTLLYLSYPGNALPRDVPALEVFLLDDFGLTCEACLLLHECVAFPLKCVTSSSLL